MSVIVLPDFPGLDIAISRSVSYNVDVQRTKSQREIALVYQSIPSYDWTLKFNALRNYVTPKEAHNLLAIFHLLQGRGDFFLYRDPELGTVSTLTQIGVGNGVNRAFQAGFNHASNGLTYFEPVTNLITPVVRKAGVTQTLNTHYTVGLNGVITFVTAPLAGEVIAWTGAHHYRVRMSDNKQTQDRIVSDIWKAQIKFATSRA